MTIGLTWQDDAFQPAGGGVNEAQHGVVYSYSCFFLFLHPCYKKLPSFKKLDSRVRNGCCSVELYVLRHAQSCVTFKTLCIVSFTGSLTHS